MASNTNQDILTQQESAAVVRLVRISHSNRFLSVKGTLFQFVSTAICLLPSITSGAILVYPVISVPYYKNATETPLNHPMTVEEQSWFGKTMRPTTKHLSSSLYSFIYS